MNLPKGITIDRLQKQIDREYQNSFSVVNTMRTKFRTQANMLEDAKLKTSMVDLRNIHNVVDGVVSLEYTDMPVTTFLPNQMTNERQAKNLTKWSKGLYEATNLAPVRHEMITNKVCRGVGLRIREGFDSVLNAPIWRTVDTRHWVPDIQQGFWRRARYEGFEFVVPFYDLLADERYKANLMTYAKNGLNYNNETELTKIMTLQASGMVGGRDQLKIEENGLIDVYHCFTRIDGYPIYSVWADNRRICLFAEEIVGVFDWEKKNKNLINFPIAHNWWNPVAGNPFGTSLIDQCADKHIVNNYLINLALHKEKIQAMWDDTYVDVRSGVNIAAISQPSLSQRYVSFDGSKVDPRQAFFQIPKNTYSQSSFNVMNYVDQAIVKTSGVDAWQLGVSSGGGADTFGEGQRLQANNNLRSMYRAKIDKEGEKEFWIESIRSMKANLPKNGKVEINEYMKIANMDYSKSFIVVKDDLIGASIPGITLVTRSEEEKIKNDRRVFQVPTFMMQLQDPNLSAGMKSMILRKVHEINGLSEEEAMAFSNPTVDEMKALTLLELINNEIEGAAEVKDLEEDHQVFLNIFRLAKDNEVKYKAMKNRMNAQIEKQKLDQEQKMEMAKLQGGDSQGAAANAGANSVMNTAFASTMNAAMTQPEVITRWQ